VIRYSWRKFAGWPVLVMVAVVACLFCWHGSLTAQTSQPASSHATPLGLIDHMDLMQESLRTLKRQILDPRKNADSANLVAEMLIHAANAKQMTPPKVRDLPSAERTDFLLAYRKKMNGLCKALLDLESALLENDNTAAHKHLETVLDFRFKGHREFKQE